MNLRVKMMTFAGMTVMGLMAGSVLAQLPLPAEAEAMRTQYNDAVRTYRTRGDDQNKAILQYYAKELTALKTKFQQAGDLAGLQTILSEQSRLEKEFALPSAEPTLEALKALYVKCRNYIDQNEAQVTSDNNALAVRYYTALEQLERRLTQEAKIEPAAAVMVYRQEFMKSLPPAAVPAPAAAASKPASDPAPVPDREKDKDGYLSVKDLIEKADRFMQKQVEVVGVIRNVDRAGRDPNRLIVQLEDGLSAAVRLESSGSRDRRDKKKNLRDRRADADEEFKEWQRLLQPGVRIALSGTLDRRMRSLMLIEAKVLKVSGRDAAKALGVDEF